MSNKQFNQSYLDVYFPSAAFMCNSIFITMCPLAFIKALQEIVTIADKKLWWYFLNNKKGFDGRYLYKIVQELSSLDAFIDQACVDTKTQQIVGKIDKDKVVFDKDRSRFQRLSLFLIRQDKAISLFDFYAVYYDYLTALFNSLVMVIFQTNGAIGQLSDTFVKIDQLVHKFSNTLYEKYYQDAHKRSKRVVTLIQTKLEERQKKR